MFPLRRLLNLAPTSNVILIDCVKDKTLCCVPASVYSSDGEEISELCVSAVSPHSCDKVTCRCRETYHGGFYK